jgi:hypothetical protein
MVFGRLRSLKPLDFVFILLGQPVHSYIVYRTEFLAETWHPEKHFQVSACWPVIDVKFYRQRSMALVGAPHAARTAGQQAAGNAARQQRPCRAHWPCHAARPRQLRLARPCEHRCPSMETTTEAPATRDVSCSTRARARHRPLPLARPCACPSISSRGRPCSSITRKQ